MDKFYLDQVKRLAAMSRMAMEEAEGWAELIKDPQMREEAQREMEEMR